MLLFLAPLTVFGDEQGVIGFPAEPVAEPLGNIYVRGIASHAWWLDPEVYGDQLLPALDDLQVTTVRLSIDWRRFEPQPGVWDWAMYDRVLGELAKRNIVVVADFNTIPGWASTDPASCDEPVLEVPTCDLRPDMDGEFANAMRAALERYSWIQHWEFWNEPEMWTHLGQDGPTYYQHLRTFYDIAHDVNPQVTVAAQTLVGYEYMHWLYEISLGIDGPDNEPWDAVSIHPYNFWYVQTPGEAPLEINYGRIEQLRALMIERGDGHKKIWVTEFGWTNDEQWQARNLPVALDWLQQQPYIEFAHLHMLHDWNDEPQDQFGLMRIIPTPNGYIVLDQNTVFEPKELYYDTFKNYAMDLPCQPPTGEALRFPETGHSIAAPFLSGWQARGGLEGPGLPLTRPYVRQGLDGAWLLVQDFERARLEYRPEHAGEQAEIVGAAVGREAARNHANLQAFVPDGDGCESAGDRLCFPETGFVVEGNFLSYWQEHHGEVLLGLPISTEFTEDSRTVQYFELGRLERDPPASGQVTLSDLVRQQLIDQGWLLPDGTPADDDLRLPTRRAFH